MLVEKIEDEALFHPRIAHGFFGRGGGVSTGIYASLNCGLGTDDDPEAVAENRRRAVRELAGKDFPLLTLRQDHTNLCFAVADASSRPTGDGLVTDVPGLALGIVTADCAPVLFSGTKPNGNPVIGAAHAGWRGALSGILGNTVAAMKKKGAMEISAAIGPCIGPESYEVGEDFKKNFAPEFFKGNHFHLPAYVACRLADAGVDRISSCAIDTYTGDYFSYRRMTHRQEPDYGRQLSAIVIADRKG